MGIHNVAMTEIRDSKSLCNIDHHLVIFPEKVPYPDAIETCKIHGGSVAVPRSEKDNYLLMAIVKMHEKSCMGGETPKKERLTWIGAENVNGIWHESSLVSHHWRSISSQSRLNFTNFLQSTSQRTYCVYLRGDGIWSKWQQNLCYYYSLCTICSIYGQPVFTLKGLCYKAHMDFNYYPVIDSNHEIKLYEGYKSHGRISFDGGTQKWKSSTEFAFAPVDNKVEFASKTVLIHWH